jgi:signal transduction histidine kinase
LLVTAFACVASFVTTGLISGFSRAFLLAAAGVGPRSVLSHPLVTLVESVVVTAWILVVAWKSPPRAASVCVVVLLLVGMHAQYFRPSYNLSRADTVQLILLVGVAAAGAGFMLRMRDRSRAALAAAAEERARREERLDMARELHDVVAHHVTGMLVQAQAALVVAEQDKSRACDMLPGIIGGGTDALGAMRAMVSTLRDNGAATATGDLTADLHVLVEKSGLPVRTSIELTEDVRPELGRSVLRLVQEALTNARKHAYDATSVEVDVRLTESALLLSVVDNGTTRPVHSGGFGLVGMRERVSELGGRFFAGATGEGWLVTAELPREVRA